MDWISVEDKLPQVNYTVILFSCCGIISTGYLSKRRPNKKWVIFDPEVESEYISHWMSLPKTPKIKD